MAEYTDETAIVSARASSSLCKGANLAQALQAFFADENHVGVRFI